MCVMKILGDRSEKQEDETEQFTHPRAAFRFLTVSVSVVLVPHVVFRQASGCLIEREEEGTPDSVLHKACRRARCVLRKYGACIGRRAQEELRGRRRARRGGGMLEGVAEQGPVLVALATGASWPGVI